jgi:thiosulfate/3-mercaptopyruvate sulfurtransferase
MTACASFIGDGLEQTMVAYSLVRYGHRNILVLDGGLDKWMEEKRAVTREFGSAEPSFFRANVRKEYFISYEQFLALREKDDVVLLDARPPAYYEGQGPWIKPGHIPGAVSLPWKGLMDDRNKKLLRPEDQIEAMVNAAGATPDRTVICSCGTGREATNEFLLFRWYLGYGKVVLYEGGFTEWSSYEDNPVVTGKSPR